MLRWLIGLALLALLATGCTARNITAVPGWAGGTIQDGEIYVATHEGKGRVGRILRLDPDNGNLMWRQPPEGDGIGPFYSTPAVDDQRVYVGSYNGRLYALLKDTGEIDRQPVTKGAIVGGVVLADDKILVASSDGSLYAYDTTEVSRVWSYQVSDKIWSTPTVADGLVYFGSLDHYVYAVSLDDGSLVWSYQTGGSIVAKPLVVNGMVVIGAFDRILYALDAKTGTLRWKFEDAESWFWAGAITDDTSIYAASLDKKLYALDMRGNLRWSFEADSDLVSTPVVTPDGIALVSDEGRIYRISTRDGNDDWFYDTSEPIRAPLSADGSMVLAVSRENTVLMFDFAKDRLVWDVSTE